METKNLAILKIHKLTEDQYKGLVEAGSVDPDAIYYLTDLVDSVDQKVPSTRTINGKDLSDDISFTPSDFGAMRNVQVTSEDNGKFMRVVNGSWEAVAVPSAEEATF